ISFPIVMGAEIFLFTIHGLYAWFSPFFDADSPYWLLSGVVVLFRFVKIWPWESLVVVASGYAVCVALVKSVFVLRQVVLHENDEGVVTSKTRQRLKSLVFAVAFSWTWLSLRYVIVHFETTRFMNLRIVLTALWDVTVDS